MKLSLSKHTDRKPQNEAGRFVAFLLSSFYQSLSFPVNGKVVFMD